MRQKFFNLRVKLLEHDMTQEEAAKIAGSGSQRHLTLPRLIMVATSSAR